MQNVLYVDGEGNLKTLGGIANRKRVTRCGKDLFFKRFTALGVVFKLRACVSAGEGGVGPFKRINTLLCCMHIEHLLCICLHPFLHSDG